MEFLHHGDRVIPPEQRFSGFARSILAGLDVPVENRFGLRPAILPDGGPAPIECEPDLDRLGLLEGVTTFNSHPHVPHFERCGAATEKLDVLARHRVDPDAPPHPFTADGRATFDSLLQSRPGVFRGHLLVGDTTLFTSTWGGVESLTRLWANLLTRTLPALTNSRGLKSEKANKVKTKPPAAEKRVPCPVCLQTITDWLEEVRTEFS